MIVTIGQIKRVLRDESGLTVHGFKISDEGYWIEDHGEFFTDDSLKQIQTCVDWLRQFQGRPRRTSVSSFALRDEVSKMMPEVSIPHGRMVLAVLVTRLKYSRRPDRSDIDVFLHTKEWMRATSLQMPLMRPLEAT
ncbi:MAG: hypothetical protein HQK57_02765 [Deltaproteobacteria bacterium]|nr:hypothetical protein [Deltaproteobacteria bacterium]